MHDKQLITVAFGRIAAAIALAASMLLANPALAVEANEVRFVWVDKLIVRSQPDSKSAEVTRLGYGSRLTLEPDATTPVSHQEILFKLKADPEKHTPAANVAIDGYWRRITTGTQAGWVFDGYLSHFPVPQQADSNLDDLDYVIRVFGGKIVAKWANGDSTATPSYRLLMKRGKFEKDASDFEWKYAELGTGGTYESVAAFNSVNHTERTRMNLPMTFNEAVLWARQFFAAGRGGGTVSGRFEPGHLLQVSAVFNTDGATSWSNFLLDCHAEHSNISDDGGAD